MKRTVAAILAIVGITACGGDSGTATTSPSASGSPASTTPLPGTFPVQHGTFTFNAVSNSGVTGTAYVTTISTGFTVSVALNGLGPTGPKHVTELVEGTCASPGTLVTALGAVGPDLAGTSFSNTTVNKPYTLAASGWAIIVHQGSDLSTDANKAVISCATMGPLS